MALKDSLKNNCTSMKHEQNEIPTLKNHIKQSCNAKKICLEPEPLQTSKKTLKYINYTPTKDVSKKETSVVISKPVLSPETATILENAERIIKDAKLQMAQISMTFNQSKAWSNGHNSLIDLSVDDKNQQLLYIRELVKSKFHQINYQSEKSLEINNEQQQFLEEEQNANLSTPMFKYTDKGHNLQLQCKKQNENKNFCYAEQICPVKFDSERVKYNRHRSVPVYNCFQGNKCIEKVNSLCFQRGPTIDIGKKLTTQNIENFDILPNPVLSRGNANVASYNVKHGLRENASSKHKEKCIKFHRNYVENIDLIKNAQCAKETQLISELESIEKYKHHISNGTTKQKHCVVQDIKPVFELDNNKIMVNDSITEAIEKKILLEVEQFNNYNKNNKKDAKLLLPDMAVKEPPLKKNGRQHPRIQNYYNLSTQKPIIESNKASQNRIKNKVVGPVVNTRKKSIRNVYCPRYCTRIKSDNRYLKQRMRVMEKNKKKGKCPCLQRNQNKNSGRQICMLPKNRMYIKKKCLDILDKQFMKILYNSINPANNTIILKRHKDISSSGHISETLLETFALNMTELDNSFINKLDQVLDTFEKICKHISENNIKIDKFLSQYKILKCSYLNEKTATKSGDLMAVINYPSFQTNCAEWKTTNSLKSNKKAQENDREDDTRTRKSAFLMGARKRDMVNRPVVCNELQKTKCTLGTYNIKQTQSHNLLESSCLMHTEIPSLENQRTHLLSKTIFNNTITLLNVNNNNKHAMQVNDIKHVVTTNKSHARTISILESLKDNITTDFSTGNLLSLNVCTDIRDNQDKEVLSGNHISFLSSNACKGKTAHADTTVTRQSEENDFTKPTSYSNYATLCDVLQSDSISHIISNVKNKDLKGVSTSLVAPHFKENTHKLENMMDNMDEICLKKKFFMLTNKPGERNHEMYLKTELLELFTNIQKIFMRDWNMVINGGQENSNKGHNVTTHNSETNDNNTRNNILLEGEACVLVQKYSTRHVENGTIQSERNILEMVSSTIDGEYYDQYVQNKDKTRLKENENIYNADIAEAMHERSKGNASCMNKALKNCSVEKETVKICTDVKEINSGACSEFLKKMSTRLSHIKVKDLEHSINDAVSTMQNDSQVLRASLPSEFKKLVELELKDSLICSNKSKLSSKESVDCVRILRRISTPASSKADTLKDCGTLQTVSASLNGKLKRRISMIDSDRSKLSNNENLNCTTMLRNSSTMLLPVADTSKDCRPVHTVSVIQNTESDKENSTAHNSRFLLSSKKNVNSASESRNTSIRISSNEDSLNDCISIQSFSEKESGDCVLLSEKNQPMLHKIVAHENICQDYVRGMSLNRDFSLKRKASFLSQKNINQNDDSKRSTTLSSNTTCRSGCTSSAISDMPETLSSISRSEGELYISSPRSCSCSLGELRIVAKGNLLAINMSEHDHNIAVKINKDMLTTWDECTNSLLESIGDI